MMKKGKKRWKVRCRRAAAWLLAAVMTLGVPAEAWANLSVTKENTRQENDELYETVKRLYGDDATAEAVYGKLLETGLLDTEGNLVTKELVLDGKKITLDEARALVNDPNTDQDRIVTVDGRSLSIGDLKVMIQIEDELKRIQDTYFGGEVENTPELEDLIRQLNSDGISVEGFQELESDTLEARSPEVVFGSGLDHTVQLDFGDVAVANKAGKATVTFTLNKPQNDDVTFVVNTIDGSAEAGVNYVAVKDQAVTIEKGQTSAKLDITILEQNNTLTYTNNAEVYNGEKIFIVQVEDLKNARLVNDAAAMSRKVSIKAEGVTFPRYNGDNGQRMFGQPKTPKSNGASAASISEEDKYLLTHSWTDLELSNNVLPGGLLQSSEHSGLDMVRFQIWLTRAFYSTIGPYIESEDKEAYEQLTPIAVGEDYFKSFPNGAKYIAGLRALYDSAPESTKNVDDWLIYYDTIKGNIYRSAWDLHEKYDIPVTYVYYRFDRLTALERKKICDNGYTLVLKGASFYYEVSGVDSVDYYKTDNGAISKPTFEGYENKYDYALYSVQPPLTVKKVSAPAGNYRTGAVIPVVLHFNQPVKAGDVKIRVTDGTNGASGETLAPIESADTMSCALTFEYQVQSKDNSDIHVRSVDGKVTTYGGDKFDWTMADTVVQDVKPKDVVKDTLRIDDALRLESTVSLLEVDKKEGYSPADSTAKVTMQMPENAFLRKQLTDNPWPLDGGRFACGALGLSTDGGKTIVPLVMVNGDGVPVNDKPAALTAEIPLPINMGSEDIITVAELYQLNGNHEADYIRLGNYAEILQKPAVYLKGTDLEIIYPQDWEKHFNDNDHPDNKVSAGIPPAPEQLKLDFKVNGTGFTWQNRETDFKWESTNPSVAMIDEKTGQITLTGEVGEASFILTALNGGYSPQEGENPEEYQAAATKKLVTSPVYYPYLSLTDSMKKITDARAGSPVSLIWSTNLFDKNAAASGNEAYETPLTLKVYKARYEDGRLVSPGASDMPVHTVTVTGTKGSPVHQYMFNGLDDVSEGGKASYVITVEASALDGVPLPVGVSPDFRVQSEVYVKSRPAEVKLERPQNLFMTTEAGTLPIPWSLAYFDRANGGEFSQTVTDNDTGNVVAQAGSDEAKLADQGRVDLPLKAANGFCSIYTVEAKVKNPNEDAWSKDSFVIYVYDKDSLDILVNGGKEDEYTLSNRDWIKNLYSGGEGQQAVLDLNRDINLQNVISINYGDHAWTELADRMKWTAESEDGGESPASINYHLGSQYYNVDDLAYTSYAPAEEFLLSGSRDGISKVTASHALVGDAFSSSLDVKVETLTDRLYLFQFYPAQTTTITYTDGEGKSHTVESEPDGRAAVYEETGITGSIFLKSRDKDGTVWLGTMYADRLETGEQDAVTSELYPVNNMSLQKQGEVSVRFVKPDGTGYDGKITVRGGMLKKRTEENGTGYAEGVNLDQIHDGTKDYVLDLSSTDGSHTFIFDTTQGDLDIHLGEEITFVLEVRPEDGYYPMFLEYNGTLNTDEQLKMGTRVANLEEVETESSKEKPFLASQRARFGKNTNSYSLDIRGMKGKVGPSKAYPQMFIDTVVLWWGTKSEGFTEDNTIRLCDGSGNEPPATETETLMYPFSTMPVTRSTITLNEKNMEDWNLPSGGSRGLTIKYTDSADTTVKTEDMGIHIINALDLEDVIRSANLVAMLEDTTTKAGGVDSTGKMIGNGMVSTGVALATALRVDLPVLQLKLAPTTDPTLFKGLVFIGLNNMTDNNITGMDPDVNRVDDIDAFPGLTDMGAIFGKGGPGGYAKKSWSQLKYAAGILKGNFNESRATGSSQAKSADGKVSISLTGYFESEIYFDYDTHTWKMQVLNGGFTAGGGYGRDWSWNTFVGPVPVLAQLGFGASVLTDFKAAMNHMVPEGSDYETDYLLELRIMAYIRAFGGLGFDYAIMALKIGLFGQLSLDARMDFLWRHDASDMEFAHRVSGSGEVGVEFLVKLLFFTYERVLWGTSFDLGETESGNWANVQKYWEEVGKGKSGNEYPLLTTPGKARMAASARMAEPVAYDALSGRAVYSISMPDRLESRDYLDTYERSWEGGTSDPGFFGRLARSVRKSAVGQFFLGPVEEKPVETVWENAYPYAAPAVNDDGSLMVCLTDQASSNVTKTRAAYAVNERGAYTELKLIDDAGYGDSQLSMAGSGDGLSVAAWSRIMEEPPKKEGGAEITDAEQVAMMQSTDVMAAVYDAESGAWKTTRLTESDGADLAPVAAVSGNRAIVAWRGVAGTDGEHLTAFDSRDDILYRVYDGETGEWSRVRRIYNGTSGSVMGIQAAMMPDGTAAVTYTVDTGLEGSGETVAADPETGVLTSGLEVFYSIVNTDCSVGDEWSEEQYEAAGVDSLDGTMRTVRLTSDQYTDENPQIAAVKIGEAQEEENEGYRFILGWHSIQNADGIQKEDIRLRSIDRTGLIDSRFPDSLSSLTANADVFIGGDFQFSRGAERLDDLYLVWKKAAKGLGEEEPEAGDLEGEGQTDGPVAADHDLINAIQFRVPENGEGKISVTAAQTIGSMADNTTADSFSAYRSGNGVKALVLGTYYDMDNPQSQLVSYGEDTGSGENTTTVVIPGKKSGVFRVSGELTDRIALDSVIPEYTSIYAGARVPVQISVRNMGTQPVTDVEISFYGGSGLFGRKKADGGYAWRAEQPEGRSLESRDAAMTPIAPGESRTLTGYCQVPEQICNIPYQVDAMFEDGSSAQSMTGTLNLDIPDLGIAGLKIKKAQDGKRVIQMSLYNAGQSKLADRAGDRTVKVGIYQDQECTQQVDSRYLREVTSRAASEAYLKKIEGREALEQIDQGYYTLQYEFDAASYIEQTEGDGNERPYASEDGEIRDGGFNLYVKAWIEGTDPETGEAGELVEYINKNNEGAVRVSSLLEQSGGEAASLKVTVLNEGGEALKSGGLIPESFGADQKEAEKIQTGTRAVVEVQNNSIQAASSGNLIGTLLDSNGKVIEMKQLYDPEAEDDNYGLIQMGPEGTAIKELSFSRTGADVQVRYTDENLEAGGAELSRLTVYETDVTLDSFAEATPSEADGSRMITIRTENRTHLNVYAEAENKTTSTITINGGLGEHGTASGTVNTRPGTVSQIVITVSAGADVGDADTAGSDTAGRGTTDKKAAAVETNTYIINVINRMTESKESDSGGQGELTLPPESEEMRGGEQS